MAEIEDRYYSMPEIMKYLGISQRYGSALDSNKRNASA